MRAAASEAAARRRRALKSARAVSRDASGARRARTRAVPWRPAATDAERSPPPDSSSPPPAPAPGT